MLSILRIGEETPLDSDDHPDDIAFDMPPSARLLRMLCRYTGAIRALLLNSSGPGQAEDSIRQRWRESGVGLGLPSASEEATHRVRPRP